MLIPTVKLVFDLTAVLAMAEQTTAQALECPADPGPGVSVRPIPAGREEYLYLERGPGVYLESAADDTRIYATGFRPDDHGWNRDWLGAGLPDLECLAEFPLISTGRLAELQTARRNGYTVMVITLTVGFDPRVEYAQQPPDQPAG